MSQRPLLAASVAVFREGRVLLAERGKGLAKGLWSLPGGKLEYGETLAACALRELYEEVAVVAVDPVFVDHVEMIGPDFHAVICAYAARWVSGEGEIGPEAPAVLWCLPEDVAMLPTTPHLAEVIAKAKAAMRLP